MDKDKNNTTRPWKNTDEKNCTTSNFSNDFPQEMPDDVIPDEVPRKDGPGGE